MALFGRDPDGDDESDERGRPGGRSLVIAAIVVGAAVICGVVVVLLSVRESQTPAAAPTDPSSAPATTVPTATPTGGGPATPGSTTSGVRPSPSTPGVLPCKLPAVEEGMSEAPAGVSWDFVDGILIPTKASIGAGITDEDGLRRCFRRSPAGAVFAAFTALAQAQDARRALAVAQRRVVPGTGQQAAVAQARRALASPTPDSRRNSLGQIQYVGYKVVDYTEDRAVLSVAIQVDPEHVGGLAVTMVWNAGDWKVQLRPDGQLGPDPDVLASLGAYVRFRGS